MTNRDRTRYVNLLECADGMVHTGISLGPQWRVKQHNAGRGARYTCTRLPVRLLGSVAMQGWAEALCLEKRVKGRTPQRRRASSAEP
jgi:putative endonuclease